MTMASLFVYAGKRASPRAPLFTALHSQLRPLSIHRQAPHRGREHQPFAARARQLHQRPRRQVETPRPRALPRLEADAAAQGLARRALQDGHDHQRLARLRPIRRDAQLAQVCQPREEHPHQGDDGDGAGESPWDAFGFRGSLWSPKPSAAFRRLPLPSAAFHCLPPPATAFRRLPLPSAAFHCLPPPSTAFRRLPLLATDALVCSRPRVRSAHRPPPSS